MVTPQAVVKSCRQIKDMDVDSQALELQSLKVLTKSVGMVLDAEPGCISLGAGTGICFVID